MRLDPAFGLPPEPPQVIVRDEEKEKHLAQQGEEPTSPSPIELQEQSAALRKALLQYQDLDIDPCLDLNVDKCTWDNVLRYMSQVGTEYEEKAKR